MSIPITAESILTGRPNREGRDMVGTSDIEFAIDVLYDQGPPGTIGMDGTRDGRWVFWFEPSGDGRQRAWVNGRRLEPFDQLLPFANGRPWLISPAGGRFAYIVRRGTELYVGVDDHEYGPFPNVSKQIEPFFSPDDRHLVFATVVGDDARLVIDGATIPGIRPAAGRPLYSADGSRLACIASRKDTNVHEWVVLDGRAQPEFDAIGDGSMTFSEDGRRFAYAGRLGSTIAYVVDGNPEATFAEVGRGVFSPDGGRFAYPASDERRWFMVDGENRGPGFDRVATPVFSPDGGRLAYVIGEAKGKLHVIVDDVVGPSWDAVAGPVFSPDRHHVAYVGEEEVGGLLRRKRSFRLVVDGNPGPAFDEIGGAPEFAPDGRLAIAARSGGRWSMVVDGAPGKPFEWVRAPAWSAAGRLGYVAGDRRGVHVVVDEAEGPAFRNVLDFEGRFVTFSPDGRHCVYHGEIEGAQRVVVDGSLGPPMQGLDHPAFETDGVSFLGMHDDRIVRLRAAFRASLTP